jgi:hypothetical protein
MATRTRKLATVTATVAAATAAANNLPTNPANLAPAANPAAAMVAPVTTWQVPCQGGGRKVAPAATTVAGMLLATLAAGPATLAMCAAAVAHGNTGKVHPLRPLLAYMAKNWGYGFACHNGTLAVVQYPANCHPPGCFGTQAVGA